MFNLDHPDSMVKMTHESLKLIENQFTGGEIPDTGKTANQLNQMTFAFANDAVEHLPNWVKVSSVVEPSVYRYFDVLDYMHSVGIKRPTDPKYNRYRDRLCRLQNIWYSRHIVRTLNPDFSFDLAQEICERFNPQWK